MVTTTEKDVGEGMLIMTKTIANWIRKHELSKRKRNELGQGIVSLFKKKRKINGTSNKSSKRKRNDVGRRRGILSNKKKSKRNYVSVEQDKLLSKRKRNDVEEEEEEDKLSKRNDVEREDKLSKRNNVGKGDDEEAKESTVNLSKLLFDEDKSSRNDVGKCFLGETKDDEEAKENIIRIGDTVNLSHLFFSKNRDYLITCNHRNTTNKLVEIKAKDLAGRFIVLHFMHLADYFDTWSWKAPVANLKDLYTKLHPQGDFEIVFVALRDDHAIPSTTRQCLQHAFSMMPPCHAIPLSDQESIQCLKRIFGIHDTKHIGPTSFIIDSTGVVLQSHATPLFLRYGAAAYPFTKERIQFLDSEDSLFRAQTLSLEKLLSSPDRDYLINNKGDQVPLHNLDDKLVGLYFCPCLDRLDGPRTTGKLEMVYQELSRKVEDFEIVLIYTHGWCEHEDTCSLIDEDSFLHKIKTMPWLALPFNDTNCIKKLQRVFQYPQDLDWPRPDARLVIIGPHGEFLEPLGTHILLKYGAPAYPFTLASAVNLELERARKVKPEMLWELDAVFTRSIGSQVQFSQIVGKRIIVFYETYETDKWVKTNTLRELTARYLEMKGTDEEFEVIHILCDGKFSTRMKAPVPWFMHPPFDKDTFADEFMRCVFGDESGLLAFDAGGSVVRVTSFAQLGNNKSFPFYDSGDMENEVLLDVKEKIALTLERVYGVDLRFDHDD